MWRPISGLYWILIFLLLLSGEFEVAVAVVVPAIDDHKVLHRHVNPCLAVVTLLEAEYVHLYSPVKVLGVLSLTLYLFITNIKVIPRCILKGMFREERSDLVILLATLKEQQAVSRHPEMFSAAIKQTRRKVLGLYRQVMNIHHSIKDTVDTAGAVVS